LEAGGAFSFFKGRDFFVNRAIDSIFAMIALTWTKDDNVLHPWPVSERVLGTVKK